MSDFLKNYWPYWAGSFTAAALIFAGVRPMLSIVHEMPPEAMIEHQTAITAFQWVFAIAICLTAIIPTMIHHRRASKGGAA